MHAGFHIYTVTWSVLYWICLKPVTWTDSMFRSGLCDSLLVSNILYDSDPDWAHYCIVGQILDQSDVSLVVLYI